MGDATSLVGLATISALSVQVRISPYSAASVFLYSEAGRQRNPYMYVDWCSPLHTLPPLPYLSGKYGYKYLEKREGEGEFTSLVGQRNMIEDIIKQEIVITEGCVWF